jgi:hypothetical protein
MKPLYAMEGEWISVHPAAYTSSQWEFEWRALAGHKVNDGSTGFFEYDIALPESMRNASAIN